MSKHATCGHCEPFALCHSEPEWNEGEESGYFAQGRLREAISRDCFVAVAPRNDNFSMTFTIECKKYV